MAIQFSLAHLTVLGCAPPEATSIAARAGYDFVLRIIMMGSPNERTLPKPKLCLRKLAESSRY